MRRVELPEETEDFVRKNTDVSVTLFQVSPSKVREERPPPRPCSFDSTRQSPTLAVLKRKSCQAGYSFMCEGQSRKHLKLSKKDQSQLDLLDNIVGAQTFPIYST